MLSVLCILGAALQTGDQNLTDAGRLCATVKSQLTDGLAEEGKMEFLRLVVERIWVDKDNNLDIEVIIPRPKIPSTGVNCETVYFRKGRGNMFSYF